MAIYIFILFTKASVWTAPANLMIYNVNLCKTYMSSRRGFLSNSLQFFGLSTNKLINGLCLPNLAYEIVFVKVVKLVFSLELRLMKFLRWHFV